MKTNERPQDGSEDPNRSVDEDLPDSTQPAPPPQVGPAVTGPVVATGAPPTGEPVVEEEAPSEGQIALEREVRETRARPRR